MKNSTPFCVKRYKSLLFAAAIEQIVAVLVVASDSIISGLILNEAAVAALTVVNPIFLTLTFLSMVVTYGTEILFPYEVGKMNLKKANEYFSQSCIVSVILGVLFFTLVSLFKDVFFSYMKIDGEVLEYADTYLSMVKWAYLIAPIADTMGSMIYVDGDELISTISNAYLIIGNIGASITLTFFLGIKGVAMGTLIGYIGSSLINFCHFFRKNCTLRFAWHFSFKDLLHVSKFSIVDSLVFVLTGIISLFVQKIILENYGETFIPVFSVFITVIELTFVFDCVGSANSPILSVFRGENNSKGLKQIFNSSLKTAIVLGAILMLIVFFAAPLFPVLYGIETPEVYEMAVKAIRIGCPSMIALSLLFVITSYYLSIEKIGLSIFITLLKDCIPTLLCILIFSKFMGLSGIWFGFALGPWIALAISILFVKLAYKNQDFPYLIKNHDANIFSWSFYIEDSEVVKVRDAADKVLTEHNINPKSKNKILVLIEEALMLIKDKNPGKKVYAECTIMLEDKIKIVFRDDGEIFDMTDTDCEISSFRGFFVSSLMEHYSDKANLTTTSYDRNVFRETIIHT
ncbi:hypothetical protein DYE50_09735 [Treponema ruminis]|uniref:Na+-driven multidrug efflux pump n=1 Tax=Treponema ruminis TaxID=744515 RepID=A0A7W8LM77_9SPIR|nr:MATE family efflux transporter [Treponema ruminis]MBB5226246.1 Na+-driven multidrug efflux pump [Treponema ruminis]QSI02846.1 hypothetical protein DYE50_09735 [Treponema ruminis]